MGVVDSLSPAVAATVEAPPTTESAAPVTTRYHAVAVQTPSTAGAIAVAGVRHIHSIIESHGSIHDNVAAVSQLVGSLGTGSRGRSRRGSTARLQVYVQQAAIGLDTR